MSIDVYKSNVKIYSICIKIRVIPTISYHIIYQC